MPFLCAGPAAYLLISWCVENWKCALWPAENPGAIVTEAATICTRWIGRHVSVSADLQPAKQQQRNHVASRSTRSGKDH